MNEIFNQPVGFYVVGLPLLAACVAAGLVMFTICIVIIFQVLAFWFECMAKAVEMIREASRG